MTKQKPYTSYLTALVTFLVLIFLSACRDDYLPYEQTGEGESTLSCDVRFEPLAGALATRAPGDAIKNIKTLTVLVYDLKGKLVKSYGKGDLLEWQLDEKGNTDFPDIDGKPDNYTPTQSEAATARATFKIPKLPYGRYHIYCVANVDLTPGEMSRIENVKQKVITWKPEDISANNAMFGYFVKATDAVTKAGADGFDARTLVVNAENLAVHAWIKRCASKITVAFDGKNLKENVTIYVKSVTLHDIPRTCLLGAENKPAAQNQLWNPWNEKTPVANSVMYYKAGEREATATSGTAANPGNDFHDWMTVANGVGKDQCGIVGSDHSEKANALFFFENNQGDYEGKREFDKRQQWSEVGNNSNKPGDKDFKDNVPNGTYVEVEAYYVSRNPENISRGPIKYRFMLGKNITYNYNASRNHHFKLTLGFRGWANQPDWHIEYNEPDPGIEAPDFDVSYLYNTEHTYSFKLKGIVKSVEMRIIENNWAPYQPQTTPGVPEVPAQTVGDFQWNRDAYTTGPSGFGALNGVKAPYLGFLALQMPNTHPNIIDNKTYGKDGMKALENYYYGRSGSGNRLNQSYRKFTNFNEGKHGTGLNQWTVNKIDENTIMMHVPMWTRNKSMISTSGFSGYNPYEGYKRKALVEITAEYYVNDKTEIVKDTVQVLQVRRVVNPVGVWRKYDKQNTFKCDLMIEEGGDAKSYSQLYSNGTWEAYLEKGNGSVFDLSTSIPGTRLEGGKIQGETQTPISFNINFKGIADQLGSECGIVVVKYNNKQCVHRILVRQGILTPLSVTEGLEGAVNPKKWSSFLLYKVNGSNAKGHKAVITKNPLTMGTLFKRANLSEGIWLSNNEKYPANDWPNQGNFSLTNGTNKQFLQIDCEDEVFNKGWGKFYNVTKTDNGQTVESTYAVPSYQDFKNLSDLADYSFGILYGGGATGVQSSFIEAYGYQDFNNTGNPNPRGVRGVVVYNPDNANQIFFPFGAQGMGRRTVWYNGGNESSTTWKNRAGVLRYADVYNPLTGNDNMYRPVPYDLPHNPGAIYWIDKTQLKGYIDNSNNCNGWDMNYMSFDFGPYTANNYRDACPIKFIVTSYTVDGVKKW